MSSLIALVLRGGPLLIFGGTAIAVLAMVLAAFNFLASLAVGFTDAVSANEFTKTGFKYLGDAFNGIVFVAIMGGICFQQFGMIADMLGKIINPREKLELEEKSSTVIVVGVFLGIGAAIAYFTGHVATKDNLLGLAAVAIMAGLIMLGLDMAAEKSIKYPRWSHMGAIKTSEHDHETLD